MKQTLLFFFLIAFAQHLLAQKVELVKFGDVEYIGQRDTTSENWIQITYKPVKDAAADLERLRADFEREADFFEQKAAEMQKLSEVRRQQAKETQEQINQLAKGIFPPPSQEVKTAPAAPTPAPSAPAPAKKSVKPKKLKNR